MAQKRMFDKTITNSDDFLELPDSSQVLYFHLSMNADDDGFVNNWKSIIRMTGTKEDDLKILITKSFIIPFESGVIVIRHWRINNFLRKDRHIETKFQQELAMLDINDNQEYIWLTNGQPSIDKNSIDKNSIDKNSIDKNSIITTTNIYTYIEDNFNRTISPLEYEKINSWLEDYEENVIKYAVEKAVFSNKKTFNYVNGILKNWKSSGYKNLKEIKEEEKSRQEVNTEKKELFDYDWLNGEN